MTNWFKILKKGVFMSNEKTPVDLKKRSKQIFEIIQQTPFYYFPIGCFNALGISEKEITRKPLIGIACSWNEVNPGHAHLNWLATAVKEGIIEAGGIPMLFNTIASCDGVAMGHEGMKYILPQRDIIADSVEALVETYRLDAMVTLSSCDKINPGMLMAAARLDIPTICVPGGPNLFEIELGPQETYKGIENRYYEDADTKRKCVNCATYGACSLMGTANTFQCLMEALGMTLPNAANTPAMTSMKYMIAKESGKRILKMLEEDLRPTKIMTEKAIENALIVDMAMGGSTNTALHLPAIAHELNIKLDLDKFNEVAAKVPMIANISPSGRYSIVDLYRAGGIPALMSRLTSFLNLDCMTVSGKPLKMQVKRAKVLDEKIIMSVEKPYSKTGGTVILKGNLAPLGAVVKQSAIEDPSMLVFEGPAKVFESEKDAIDAHAAHKIPDGSAIIIRNNGPKGGPGMPELLAFTAFLQLTKNFRCALLTDARFSGATQGPMIGHICPEAYVGGPLAIVKDGDIIKIDVPNRKLNVDLSDPEIQRRLKEWKQPTIEVKSKILLKYKRLVTSADKGCILDWS